VSASTLFYFPPILYTNPMALEWRTKRKGTFFGLFLALVLVIGGLVAYSLIPAPSCTDGSLNQNEEQIDCGGPNCEPCLSEKPDDLIVLWQRFFEVRPGVYDVAALIENVNLTLGSASVPYVFELYDAQGKRIITRPGATYTLPNKQFLIFEANMETGIRRAQRVVFRLEPFTWQFTAEQALPVIVSRTVRDFTRERPRLIATLTNNSLEDIQAIDVAVIISTRLDNALAVAEVQIPVVPDSGTAEAAFTWPHPFSANPEDVQFFVRKKP
jgi:hypothetical protein